MLGISLLERGILNDHGNGIRSKERNSRSTHEDTEQEDRQSVTFVVRRRGFKLHCPTHWIREHHKLV